MSARLHYLQNGPKQALAELEAANQQDSQLAKICHARLQQQQQDDHSRDVNIDFSCVSLDDLPLLLLGKPFPVQLQYLESFLKSHPPTSASGSNDAKTRQLERVAHEWKDRLVKVHGPATAQTTVTSSTWLPSELKKTLLALIPAPAPPPAPTSAAIARSPPPPTTATARPPSPTNDANTAPTPAAPLSLFATLSTLFSRFAASSLVIPLAFPSSTSTSTPQRQLRLPGPLIALVLLTLSSALAHIRHRRNNYRRSLLLPSPTNPMSLSSPYSAAVAWYKFLLQLVHKTLSVIV